MKKVPTWAVIITATAFLWMGSISKADDRLVIEGLKVGDSVRFESDVYRQYRCNQSNQFSGFLWCSRKVDTQNRNGRFTKNYTIAHHSTGKVAYVNLAFDPAFFAPNEVNQEINRLNVKFREIAKVINLPRRYGLPDAVIAVWGDVALEPLTPNEISTLANGQSPASGILFDYLGQLRESAWRNLPIYKARGGSGYVWSASYDANGVGHLRLAAIDSDALAPIVASDPPAKSSNPNENLSTSDRLEALEKLGKLKASGILSDDEFIREKQRVLGD